MSSVEVFGALANEHRQRILKSLREPELHYVPNEGMELAAGVCVSQVSSFLGITQSTASHYLAVLRDAGLLTSERLGKFTYYRRDETALQALAEAIRADL